MFRVIQRPLVLAARRMHSTARNVTPKSRAAIVFSTVLITTGVAIYINNTSAFAQPAVRKNLFEIVYYSFII